MKIRITRGCYVNGERHNVGDVIDVSRVDFAQLTLAKKGEAVGETKAEQAQSSYQSSRRARRDLES